MVRFAKYVWTAALKKTDRHLFEKNSFVYLKEKQIPADTLVISFKLAQSASKNAQEFVSLTNHPTNGIMMVYSDIKFHYLRFIGLSES